jgi:hypothetical protein
VNAGCVGLIHGENGPSSGGTEGSISIPAFIPGSIATWFLFPNLIRMFRTPVFQRIDA